jgi:3-oxoacyl-[acyl-carrier-protein] synthase-3
MSDVFVHHLAHALGERRYSVEESFAAGRTVSDPGVLRRAGFKAHHVCGAGTTVYDLARRVVERLDGDLTGVGAIVYATCIPQNGSIGEEQRFRETRDVKHLMDFPASHLQADFALDPAIVIGLNQQACTGMLGSLRLARMILHSEPDVGRVLCVTADRFPEAALYEQAYNLISDGAAACIVSAEPGGFRLLACHAITNGALARASDDETVGTYFNYTCRLIEETLRKADLSMADIGWIVPQNINVKAWQILSRLLRIDLEQVFFGTIGEVAHVVSGDNIINLERLNGQGVLRAGDRLLLCMAGYGLNWQCVILERT